ncbi:hypothetical protein AWC38_SpisGene23397 [Stylophora pistillata]|uniref:Uncharacterized protein n=1 Tax=Stylophora pistillata TaxID=50429 RepID=A0A2B4R2P4_STYPI|nr:hypothetical protein AWC38_SpisGene23397 [Stylophora pistillata]
MSSEVSGKQQKYCRIGAREYFLFEHEELTIDNITDACQKHFRALIGEEMACDVLAGERGPSCKKITQVNNLKTLFVRFVQSDVVHMEVPSSHSDENIAKKLRIVLGDKVSTYEDLLENLKLVSLNKGRILDMLNLVPKSFRAATPA